MEKNHIPVCKGGGLYHAPKSTYSPETKQFVQNLLDEGKLSIIQRAEFKKALDEGKPLPAPTKSKNERKLKSVVTIPTTYKRRVRSVIVGSGAYEREKYQPINNKVSYEKEKSRLQSIMAYGADIKMSPDCQSKQKNNAKNQQPTISKYEIFDNLILEIEERDTFLKEMEMLGQGKKYKDVIFNEIANKMKQLEMIDKPRYETQKGAVESFRNHLKNLTEESKSLVLSVE